jgi:polysaccharide chain length determinant protein (PEP-CTERM system associated)
MLPGQKFTPEDVLRIAWRGKWLVVAPVLVAAMATAAVLKYLPNVYRSETTILIVPQRVPDSYVQSTVSARIQDRLQSISQQLLSRSRLEPIILEFDLYRSQRTARPMEDVVTSMRARIDIQTVRGDAFVLGFTSEDPETARRVTERLASLFIEENLRDREVLADATNQFLESQLEDARRRLIENEKRLEGFRLRHSGELPTQVQNNLQAMQNLQLRAQALTESLARDRERRLVMERQLADAQTVPTTPADGQSGETSRPPAPRADGEPPPAQGSTQQQLEQMEATLKVLRARFTAEHPDVIRAERLVKELQGRLADERAAAAAAAANAALTPSTEANPAQSAAVRRITGLRSEVAQVARDIAAKELQVNGIESEIATYRSRLEAAPIRESEMTELMRDYDTIRGVYTDLLAKREASKVAANLERRQIGEQFRVLDPARRPERPISPNRPMIALAGLGIGLALGLGLIALREVRDTTVHTEAQAVQALGLPVLATVPRMRNTVERRTRVRRLASVSAAALVATAAAAAAAYQWLR